MIFKARKQKNWVLYILDWSYQKGEVDEKNEFEVLKARKQRSRDVVDI